MRKSGGADEDTGEEYEYAAEEDLRDGGPKAQFEKMEAYVADCEEFHADNDIGERKRGAEVRYEEGECVKDAAHERHDADDGTADKRMAASGVLAGIGESFGKCHGYAGANGGGRTHEERDV